MPLPECGDHLTQQVDFADADAVEPRSPRGGGQGGRTAEELVEEAATVLRLREDLVEQAGPRWTGAASPVLLSRRTASLETAPSPTPRPKPPPPTPPEPGRDQYGAGRCWCPG